ncbi:MAG: family 20 glycosylhydrolase [Clostridia bacterium]|nr:family 20 glycosylhydrolase [Clostridia bacterium]
MDCDMAMALFEGFCFHTCTLEMREGRENTFLIGTPRSLPQIPERSEYAILIDDLGAAVVGRDHASLLRGYMALLLKIEPVSGEQGVFAMATGLEHSAFTVRNRMIHLCVFPETSYLFLKKLVRLCGVLQYTHVVLEFWGMLKFDCEPALAWPMAFTKEQAREVIREIRALGMEPIPMFNHLGHASACRVNAGKHVVLDQNPTLYDLFTPDGWSWNTQSPTVWELLKAVRHELYELFGEGAYFHAGLDESYMHAKSPAYFSLLPDFLARLTEEIVREGRRPMIWMDMFLPEEAYVEQRMHACTKGKTPAACEAVLSRLAKETVLIDWHYSVDHAPVPTAIYLLGKGFDIMGAPWFDAKNIAAYVETAKTTDLFGVMETTWHTAAHDMYNMLYFARLCGAAKAPWSDYSGPKEETATLLRKVTFEPHDYAEAGWMREQINLGAAKMC